MPPLTLPTPGGDRGTWGDQLNAALTQLDASKLSTTVLAGPGIDPAGNADSRAALQAKLDAAAGDAFLPRGTYLLAGPLSIPAGVHLRGEQGTRLVQGFTPGLFEGVIVASGTFTDTDAAVLTSNVGARTTILTVGSTADLTPGGFYMLGANRAYADATGGSSGDSTRYRGELVRIATVDSATQVTLHGMVRDNYSTANAASLRAISFAERVGLSDLTIVNLAPKTRVGDLVKLSFVRDFTIRNVRWVQGDGCGLHLDTCLDGTVVDCAAVDLTDDIANNRYGYGINAVRATENVTIVGLRVERGRHAFTTNGKTGFRGVPRNVQIIGGISDRSSSSAWDTHVQGDHISFLGCQATNCQVSAFTVRAPNTRVINPQVDFCGNGVDVAGTASGTHIKGGSFRRLVRNEASSQGRGALIGSASGVVVEDNTVDGSWFESLYLYGNPTNLLIQRNTFRNPGIGTGGASGIVVDAAAGGSGNRILRNHIEDGATGNPALPGNLLYPVDLGAPAAASWTVADNTALGASQAVFVRDLGTSTVKVRNRHLDRAEDRAAGLAPTGVIAESYSRVGGPVSSVTFLVSGRQSFVAVWLSAGQAVNSLSFVAGGTAATAPVNQWFSLYDANRNKLAVTVDDTTAAWAAFGRKTLALTAPYTVPTTGLYYVGIVVVAGTVPSLGGAAVSGHSTGLPPKLVGFDATNTTLTTPATAPATAAALSDISAMPYVAVTGTEGSA